MIGSFAARPQVLAFASATIDLCLVALKLGLGLATGSLALVSDAVHSGLDTVASFLAFIGVRTASHPPDRDHPFGHGKAENMAAYTEGLLLVAAAVFIVYEAVRRLVGQTYAIDPSPLALAFLVVTVVLEIVRSTVLRRVAAATDSAAIEALAADKLADLLSVTAVLVGLGAVRLGFAYGDSLAALAVAAIILRAAFHLIRQSVDVLMDRAVQAVEKQVLEAARAIPGVRDARSARIRRSGAKLIGDVEVAGRPTLPLEGVQGLAEQVRREVSAKIPQLDLHVYVAPGVDPTRLVERVHATAARNGRFSDLHDVIVEREEDESLHLSLHAKLPGSMRMSEATRHERELERELRAELPEVSKLDLHLEPLEPDIIHGQDVTGSQAALVEQIRQAVGDDGRVVSCDDVELSSRDGKITAYVKVTVPDELTLDEAHDIETAVEERVRRAVRDVKQVVVRALGG